MKYHPNADLYERILANIKAQVVKPREGIHLSDLELCLRKAYFRKKGLAPDPSVEQLMLYSTGLSYQKWLFPDARETTIIVDGIHCSPDVFEGIEVKSTRASSDKFKLEEMEHWLFRLKGYCKVKDQLHWDLVILFVCGNYKPPFPTLPYPLRIDFEPDEIAENWETAIHKKELLCYSLEHDVIPPLIYTLPWECGRCECLPLCKDVPKGSER